MKATALGLSLELSKVEIGLNPLRVLALEAAGSASAMDWRLFAFSPGEGFVGTLAVTGEPAHLEYRSLCLNNAECLLTVWRRLLNGMAVGYLQDST